MAEEIGGVDSKSLAESVAAAVVANPPEPEVPPVQVPGEDLSGQVAEGETPAVEEVVPDIAPVVEPAEPVVETPPPTLDELTLELARMGIDLGVNRAELAEEVQPMYDRFAQQALTQAHQMQSRQDQLQDAQAEIQQFAQKLQDDPQKVLLTMAVTNPEAFQETVQAYERMAEDEFYRNTVIKDLQAEA